MNILIIGDTHIPFEHPHYLQFCKKIYKKYKCTKVVHIGDLVDNHAISYHEHDPNGWSPEDEMKEADKHLKGWFKAFPEVYLCRGNHDALIDRKGKTVGLPRRSFKPFREIWNLPDKWCDDFEWELDGILFKHGTGFSGKLAHITAAENARQSCVIGHLPAYAGISYSANSKDIIFGMNVGSGIKQKAYAFSYGKDFKKKPIVSCGVIVNKIPMIIPMEMK